jgi:hypothetical protein
MIETIAACLASALASGVIVVGVYQNERAALKRRIDLLQIKREHLEGVMMGFYERYKDAPSGTARYVAKASIAAVFGKKS